MSDEYVHRMALEAYEWHKSGAPPSAGHVGSNAGAQPGGKRTKTPIGVITRRGAKSKQREKAAKAGLAKIAEDQIDGVTKTYATNMDAPAADLLPKILEPVSMKLHLNTLLAMGKGSLYRSKYFLNFRNNSGSDWLSDPAQRRIWEGII